ncbi:MDR family MFS transporter [Nocardioides halotolerans]|uniref:MDR family MFS transporter n=1 Tax=Nocardioides halotolerans TaxID=433660 RepID=UPI000401F5EE|nr:MDR family MFS transporter [Nocardioides halotolerans]
MNASPSISRADVGLRSERGPILLAVMLSVGLVAIDATILATAVPAVVDDLGGFTQFPWLFSIYLLSQAVSVPLYSKLADQYGRKPMMLLGVGLFLLGSLLCGLAWNMVSLIAFRAVQGLGAGAVQPIGLTIIGDIYSVAERAKVQGYVASVWALASVVGPTLGGVFADYLSWRWIFFVNLPLGAAVLWMFVRRFEERVDRAPHRIDVLGSLLLSGGGVLLLLGLLEGGLRWSWSSPTSITIFATAAVLLVAFVLVERRAAEPVLPLWVFRHRVIVPAILTSLVVGVLLIGLTSYVPLFAQGVLGHGAVMAGFALAALTLGWPLSAANAGRLYLSIGYRATMVIGAVFGLAGALLLLTIDGDSSLLHLSVPCFVMGVGFGFAVAPSVIAAQSAVPWESRGVTTGATMFARTVGSAVGVAVFGALVNGEVTDRIGHARPDLEHLSPAVLEPAIHTTFVCSAVVAVALVLVSALMPRKVEELERQR